MSDQTLANISVLLLIVMMLSFLGYVIFQVIKNEKLKNRYKSTMKVGDNVYYQCRYLDGKISNISGDDVEITFKCKAGTFFPNNKKDE